MAANTVKSNVFTVRIKPELLTVLDRYAEDNTNGNRSAAANYFLELGLQQAGILPKPITMEDVEKLFEERLKESVAAINQFTDDSNAKQTAVQSEMTRQAIRDIVPKELSETSQKLLEAGETQQERINEAVTAAVEEKVTERLDQIAEQTKPKKGFFARLFSE